MEDLAALFNAFYTHFVLRDLLAKITPGAIVLVAISMIFIWQPENVARYLAELSFWAWTIFLAFSWIIGITLQSIGEFLGIGSYPKEKFKTHKEWFEFHVEFSHSVRVTEANKNRVERYAVIKEACGIGSIALLIVNILLAVKIVFLLEDFLVVGGYDKIGILIIGLVIAIIFMFSLHRMHKEHVQRQYDYMLAVMDS
jgi:hypothetical protein